MSKYVDKLLPGRTLKTRDGRKIGNAVILGKDGVFQVGGVKVDVYRIQTDFGNYCRYIEHELDELFHLDELGRLDFWETDLASRRIEQSQLLDPDKWWPKEEQ